ncbi:integrase arm-type DNA-binding domain-containing protein [Bradyrhizobium sediminis]|uniref:Integrase arm-type DNA-binding domain-containing protein n=1 Tax=Bradyrhizobium sediminis TaxID=2840469 RepID=A0A975NEH4_9BRAD|nr:site-specific integrase [Bradyrhizobium sediminis]QWG13638.1 integrase arm-type DNA-binding domain-containing protein [Bradyrhizobium sediminis]
MLEKLSPAAITRKAEYRKPGRYADGGGLYLQVTPKRGDDGVTRAWLFQYSWQGKVRQMGLGSFVNVSLAQARKRAKAARDKVADGIDPIGEKKAERKAASVKVAQPQSFEAFANDYIATHSPSWRSEIHRKQWTSTLKTYAFPIIGRMAVPDIETADVLRVVKPIWTTKQETADRVRGRIEKILHAAKAQELRSGDNPAVWRNHLSHLLPKRKKKTKDDHFPAMPYEELPAFMCELIKRQGISPRALEVCILTVARTGSLIGMRQDELDMRNEHTWTIPAWRMKRSEEEHIVPLPERAREIIKTIPREKGSPYIFMGTKPQTHLSNMAMLELLRGMLPDKDYVVHGFRSSFNDWASEQTDAKHIVVEKAMAHAIKDKTEAAYRRGELLELRRTLMDQWANYIYGGKQ